VFRCTKLGETLFLYQVKGGMILELAKRQKDILIGKLQDYYFDAYHEQLGLIGAENFYSFIMTECAPLIYNLALKDARQIAGQQMASLMEELDVLEKR
jgi:Uncharacterized conserved protein